MSLITYCETHIKQFGFSKCVFEAILGYTAAVHICGNDDWLRDPDKYPAANSFFGVNKIVPTADAWNAIYERLCSDVKKKWEKKCRDPRARQRGKTAPSDGVSKGMPITVPVWTPGGARRYRGMDPLAAGVSATWRKYKKEQKKDRFGIFEFEYEKYVRVEEDDDTEGPGVIVPGKGRDLFHATYETIVIPANVFDAFYQDILQKFNVCVTAQIEFARNKGTGKTVITTAETEKRLNGTVLGYFRQKKFHKNNRTTRQKVGKIRNVNNVAAMTGMGAKSARSKKSGGNAAGDPNTNVSAIRAGAANFRKHKDPTGTEGQNIRSGVLGQVSQLKRMISDSTGKALIQQMANKLLDPKITDVELKEIEGNMMAIANQYKIRGAGCGNVVPKDVIGNFALARKVVLSADQAEASGHLAVGKCPTAFQFSKIWELKVEFIASHLYFTSLNHATGFQLALMEAKAYLNTSVSLSVICSMMGLYGLPQVIAGHQVYWDSSGIWATGVQGQVVMVTEPEMKRIKFRNFPVMSEIKTSNHMEVGALVPALIGGNGLYSNPNLYMDPDGNQDVGVKIKRMKEESIEMTTSWRRFDATGKELDRIHLEIPIVNPGLHGFGAMLDSQIIDGKRFTPWGYIEEVDCIEMKKRAGNLTDADSPEFIKLHKIMCSPPPLADIRQFDTLISAMKEYSVDNVKTQLQYLVAHNIMFCVSPKIACLNARMIDHGMFASL